MGIYGLDSEQVLVITPDVGGSFGAKFRCYPEEALLGWTGLPSGAVRVPGWRPRTQSMTGLGSGRGQIQDVVMGGSRDGRITAYQLDVIQDSGGLSAYCRILASHDHGHVHRGLRHRPAPDIRRFLCLLPPLPNGAFRGAGRPEATSAIERAVDLFAAEIGMDPAEVRRRNFSRFRRPSLTSQCRG